jgi:hypothetical protein
MMLFRNRFQIELDHAVATATGEDLEVIRQRGFSMVNPHDQDFDPEPDLLPPQYVDWDEVEMARNAPVVYQPVVSTRRVA